MELPTIKNINSKNTTWFTAANSLLCQIEADFTINPKSGNQTLAIGLNLCLHEIEIFRILVVPNRWLAVL